LTVLAGAALSWNLAACAGPARIAEPTPAPAPAPALASASRTAAARLSPARAERLVAQGHLRAALEEYGILRAKAPKDPVILASLLATVRALSGSADAEYSRGEFAAAGRGYRLLCDGYPRLGAVAAALPLDLPTLRRRLESCASRLTGAGLERYRRGELAEAMRLWRAVLSFDPERMEVRRAIDGAAAQERVLRDGGGATTDPAASPRARR
jgi:tetratricopeptide (TPR) repeat protein